MMKRKKRGATWLSAAVFPAVALLLGWLLAAAFLPLGRALAAGGASPMLPGGAALGFWRCDGGSTTEIVVENVRDYAVAVHLVVYDDRSREVMDFTVPLSEHDIWGATLSCSGNQMTIRAWASHFSNETPVHWAPVPANPYGFLAVAVTSFDTSDRILYSALTTPTSTWSLVSACDPFSLGLPCNNGDPRDDYNWTGKAVKLPNAIILRTMFVSPSSGRAIALNGVMLQDFVNLGPLTGDDDSNGIKISLPELLAFNVRNGGTIVAYNGRVALGSYDGKYFFPYVNENGVNTRFWLMMPFQGGTTTITISNIYYACNFMSGPSRTLSDVSMEPLPVQYPGRALLEVQVPSHGINFPGLGISSQPLPLFGVSIVESSSSSGFYYATLSSRAVCVDTGVGIVRLQEGN